MELASKCLSCAIAYAVLNLLVKKMAPVFKEFELSNFWIHLDTFSYMLNDHFEKIRSFT